MKARAQVQNDLLPVDDGQEATTQILTFRLGTGVFGIHVGRVREVLDMTPITPVPNAPPSLLGMVDVRHEGVPVIDLKQRLRIMGSEVEAGLDTRIVVLEIDTGETASVIAILADAVLEVVEHDPATLDGPPNFGERWDASFIHGIGRRGDEFLTLLDIGAIFRIADAGHSFP